MHYIMPYKKYAVLSSVLIICLMLAACGSGPETVETTGFGGGADQPATAAQPTTANPEVDLTAAQEALAVPAAEEAIPAEPEGPPEINFVVTKPYDDARMELLAEINQWRLEEGLWPFKVNDTLTAFALAQANYVASLPSAPDDPHASPDGQPRERALAGGWPFYNNPGQMAVGEVAYDGTMEAALNYWRYESQIHHDTVASPGFREIGVAIVPGGQYGDVFMVMVGARENVLPVLYEPLSHQIYFSTERHRWSEGPRMHDVTRFQLLPTGDTGIIDEAWQNYATSLEAPEGVGPNMVVAYTDEEHIVETLFDLEHSILWLPENIHVDDLTITLHPDAHALLEAEGVTDFNGINLPESTVEPTQQASGRVEGTPDITLIYGPHSMVVLNNPPGDRLDISGLEFHFNQRNFDIHEWDHKFLIEPVHFEAFQVGNCLVAVDFSHSEEQEADEALPAECTAVASLIDLDLREHIDMFWIKHTFTVYNRGEEIQLCPAVVHGETEICELDLP